MIARIVTYGVGLAIVGAAAVVAVQSEAEPVSNIAAPPPVDVEPWACPIGTVGRVQCAYVRVPQDYDDPEIEQIRLFTARIEPPQEATGSPIAFLSGALGAPTVVDLGGWQQVARALGRELILIDLRGTGASRPALTCSELRVSDWLEADLAQPALAAALDELTDAVAACHARLTAAVPLTAYSLDAMASDLDVVRERYGIDKWSIAAGGDAGLVARRGEQLHGDRVESLLLFGAAPASADPFRARYEYAQEVLDAALGERVGGQLIELAGQLEGRSVVFPVDSGGRFRRISVSEEVIVPIVAREVADPDFRTGAEAFIVERLGEDQWRGFANLRARQHRLLSQRSIPVRLGVLCSDPARAAAVPLWEQDDFDPMWTGLLDDLTFDPVLCDAWPVDDDSATPDAPSVPVLVVNGVFDLAAPRSAAEAIDVEWPTATVVTLAQSGRPGPFEPCSLEAMQSFLDPAARKIGEACT